MKLLWTTCLALAMTACGGGGGGGGTPAPVASTLSFPLLSGFKALTASGWSKSFTVSGSCTGSGSSTTGPASAAATFEGQTALAASIHLVMNFTSCPFSNIDRTGTDYADSNYLPLGTDIPGSSYSVRVAPVTIPASVKVGDSGPMGTENEYADSSKTSSDGHEDQTYVVEADGPETAIVNFISKSYDATGALRSVEQDRYRITASGTLTAVSADLEYKQAPFLHLILTYH